MLTPWRWRRAGRLPRSRAWQADGLRCVSRPARPSMRSIRQRGCSGSVAGAGARLSWARVRPPRGGGWRGWRGARGGWGGGPGGVARAREQLADRGLALILDYVPNHVAPDHPWVTDRPWCFLRGSEEELMLHPEAFIRIAGSVFAKGRDPYFEPWQDVLQLNAYSPALRDTAAETVIAIGDQCDGLRCDMAMLMTNEVFARTWSDRAGPEPDADYWPILIGRCKQAHPDLLFIAEGYWDMESTLEQQGFDLCYDKRLYDRLVHDTPKSLRGHLQADAFYQEHLIRFIENHDEPRAAATIEAAQARAAAVVIVTLQGARLYHDGQLEGLRTRLPVKLWRGTDEPLDSDL